MIQPIYDSGIAFILAFQAMGAWLNPPMQLLSFLGNDLFFLLVAPVIFWSIDAALGLRLGLFLMVSASVNEALKLIMHSPRPYWYSTTKTRAPCLAAAIPAGAPDVPPPITTTS